MTATLTPARPTTAQSVPETARGSRQDGARFAPLVQRENVGLGELPKGIHLRPATRADMANALKVLSEAKFSIAGDFKKNPYTIIANLGIRDLDLFEWFDMGEMTYRSVFDAGEDAVEFVDAGLFVMPFPWCCIRVRITGGFGFAVNGSEIESDAKEMVLLVYQDSDDADRKVSVMLPVGFVGGYAAFGDIATTSCADGKFCWGPIEDRADPTIWLQVLFGCWLIINASGVRKVRDVPSDKLNRARAKSGKPALLPVTRVYSDDYFTALRETQRRESGGAMGRHASPHPHLRRAHIRTLADGRRVGVSACVVGSLGLSGVAKRAGYVVRRPAS